MSSHGTLVTVIDSPSDVAVRLPARAWLAWTRSNPMQVNELIAEAAIRLVLDCEPRFVKPFALDKGLLPRVIFLGRVATLL